MKTQCVVVHILLALNLISSVEIVTKGLGDADSMPSSMPTEHRAFVDEQYEKFMEERKRKKMEEQNRNKPPPPPPGISPKMLGLKRPNDSPVPLTEHVRVPGGSFWFGTQMEIAGKIRPKKLSDGSQPRVLAHAKPFSIDVDCVTNEQFADFVKATNYKTESELYGWSFVLDSLASEEVREEVDGETGYGRVKDAQHWMAVKGASWKHPYGEDSDAETRDMLPMPAVHVSYKDAQEYCSWVGRRLPTELEWEFAARGGLVNKTYPWGNDLQLRHMNIWDGDFPTENTLLDGFHGPAPVKTFRPNAFGLFNMVGNVWEWVSGGSPEQRILRGGSFIDSVDGRFNHAVMVSTKQTNSGDSAANNIGFRCASSAPNKRKMKKTSQTAKADNTQDSDHIEL